MDRIAKNTRIFTGGASAIDIVGLSNGKLSVFELKRPTNIMIGALSELLFYASVTHVVSFHFRQPAYFFTLGGDYVERLYLRN